MVHKRIRAGAKKGQNMFKKCFSGLPITIGVLFGGCLAIPFALARSLDTYEMEPAAISVSGISSGGYMAQQFHVAYSAGIMGAGIIAGGPYYCAQGSIYDALFRCMSAGTWFGGPPLDQLIDRTQEEAGAGHIDNPSHMSKDRIYLFSGALDTTVETPVMDALAAYYGNFVDSTQIVYEKRIQAAHAMVTDDYGNRCDQEAAPFINDCDYDMAGILLAHIYGPLNPKTVADGDLFSVEQGEFIANPHEHGLHERAHLYVPNTCKMGARCRLHVAFHGCQQNENFIGDAYYKESGYNEWAESNHIIVLYPQAQEISMTNPKGCWDWWGYDDDHYHRQSGRQMAMVKAMIDRIIGKALDFTCKDYHASTYEHVSAGRARLCRWGSSACAAGSGDYLGLWNIFNHVAIKETALAYYEAGRCD